MAKRYEKKFKEMIVALLESGQTAKIVGEEYNLDPHLIRRWRREANSGKEAFTGKGRPSMTPHEKELYALKKELADVKMERDILKKAVSIFSKGDSKSTR